MNNEYMHLSNIEVAIVNDKGELKIREFDEKARVDEILTCENKLEIIDKQLNDLNYKLYDINKGVYLCNGMLKAQPIMFLAIIIGGTILGSIIFPTENIIAGILQKAYLSFMSGLTLCALSSIYFLNAKVKSKRQKLGIEASIEYAKTIKEQYEKELMSSNKKRVAKVDTSFEINKPISLRKQTEYDYNDIEEKIDETYQKTIDNQHKKLVLTKKRKK